MKTYWVVACLVLLLVSPSSGKAQALTGGAEAYAAGLRELVAPGIRELPGLTQALVDRSGGRNAHVRALADSIVEVATDLFAPERGWLHEDPNELLSTLRALIGPLRASGSLPEAAERSGRRERFSGAGDALINIALRMPELPTPRDEMTFRPEPFYAVLLLPDPAQWRERVLAIASGSYPQSLAAAMALATSGAVERDIVLSHLRDGGITDERTREWLVFIFREPAQPR